MAAAPRGAGSPGVLMAARFAQDYIVAPDDRLALSVGCQAVLKIPRCVTDNLSMPVSKPPQLIAS